MQKISVNGTDYLGNKTGKILKVIRAHSMLRSESTSVKDYLIAKHTDNLSTITIDSNSTVIVTEFTEKESAEINHISERFDVLINKAQKQMEADYFNNYFE